MGVENGFFFYFYLLFFFFIELKGKDLDIF